MANHTDCNRSYRPDSLELKRLLWALVLACSVSIVTESASAAPSSCPEAGQGDDADCEYSGCLDSAWNQYRTDHVAHAQQLYKRALCLMPRSEDALLGLSLLAMERKDYVLAESLCRKILELNPDNLWARKRLAYSLFLQKRYSGAADLYSDIHEEIPEDLDSRLGLAWTRVKQGRRFEASLLVSDFDDDKSKELKEDIGTVPDFGLSASFSGLGYLGESAFSHSLEYYLFGFVDYQDLVVLSFLFNQIYSFPKKNSGLYGRYNTVLKSSNFNPKLTLRYGPVGVGLGYTWLDNGEMGYSESMSGVFLLNLDRLELDLGGAWSNLDNMQIWQLSPKAAYRLTDGVKISLLGGWQVAGEDNSDVWENYFSIEGQMDWRLSESLSIKLSAWGGERMLWIDQQMLIPLNQTDLYRFGFEGGLDWTIGKHVGFMLGCYGQFGTASDNDDAKVGYLGAYLGIKTNF